MKKFTKYAAQGDFVIVRIDKLPDNLVPIHPENGNHIIAHSETGHNHVMEASAASLFKMADADDKFFEMFLSVDRTAEIEHLRSFDTHEPIQVEPGTYQIFPQREYVSQGWRKAQD